jgi:glycerophosphoryl diester phosphodiesterase
MPEQSRIEIQGHRGARGLAAENTLAGFEIALDLGVDSIETDVHLTRDDIAVLFHDPCLDTPAKSLLRSLSLEELRGHRVTGPAHVPTPVAERFGPVHGIPTLAEFFAFVSAYAGALGLEAGKTAAQRDKANRMEASDRGRDGRWTWRSMKGTLDPDKGTSTRTPAQVTSGTARSINVLTL